MSEVSERHRIEAALKRAADKAIHGTREERSGRFLPAVERSRGGKADEGCVPRHAEKRKA